MPRSLKVVVKHSLDGPAKTSIAYMEAMAGFEELISQAERMRLLALIEEKKGAIIALNNTFRKEISSLEAEFIKDLGPSHLENITAIIVETAESCRAKIAEGVRKISMKRETFRNRAKAIVPSAESLRSASEIISVPRSTPSFFTANILETAQSCIANTASYTQRVKIKRLTFKESPKAIIPPAEASQSADNAIQVHNSTTSIASIQQPKEKNYKSTSTRCRNNQWRRSIISLPALTTYPAKEQLDNAHREHGVGRLSAGHCISGNGLPSSAPKIATGGIQNSQSSTYHRVTAYKGQMHQRGAGFPRLRDKTDDTNIEIDSKKFASENSIMSGPAYVIIYATP
jgi:hypothetical protein